MKSLTIFLLLSASTATFTCAQSFRTRFNAFVVPDCAEQEKRYNELAYSGEPDGVFYCNPLTLDGNAFNYNGFSLESKGELKLIKGASTGSNTVEIPFYVRLRRAGELLPLTCDNVIYSKVEVSDILKSALNGDELIIEPVHNQDWPAKRIIKIGDKC